MVCEPIDEKHPESWEGVLKCETTDRPHAPSFRNVLLDMCQKRNDTWGKEVSLRIQGAVADLPAADAQYH